MREISGGARPMGAQDTGGSERGPLWPASAAVLCVGIAALAGYLLLWPVNTTQIDLEIYRFGGSALLDGHPIYDVGLHGRAHELLFNYPPFAAAAFAPLALIPVPILKLLWPVLNLIVLVLAVRRCIASTATYPAAKLNALTLAVTGLSLTLEPVMTVVSLGQVNLLLLALVAFDLLADRPSRWRGTWVGVAAGIKLTPLLFIPYLLLLRRFRQALVASGAFVVTVAVGFAVSPSQAWSYWFDGTFNDLRRIAPLDAAGNSSFGGLFARLDWSPGVATAASISVAGLSLLVAAWAARDGKPVLGLAICGMASAAVSPFSWNYHWVWFVPLIAYLVAELARARRWAGIALVALIITTAGWVVEWRPAFSGSSAMIGAVFWNSDAWFEHATRSTYVLVLVATLTATAIGLTRTGQHRSTGTT